MMKVKKEDGREDYFSKVYDLKEELGKGTVHDFYLFIGFFGKTFNSIFELKYCRIIVNAEK